MDPRRNTELGACKCWSQRFYQSRHNLTLCVHLNKPYLTYYWFINIELTASSTTIRGCVKLIDRTYFLAKAHRSLLALRNTTQCFSTILGAVINGERTNKSEKNMKKKVTLSRLWKGCSFAVWESKQKGAACFDSALNVFLEWLKYFAVEPVPTNDLESAENFDFGVTNKL